MKSWAERSDCSRGQRPQVDEVMKNVRDPVTMFSGREWRLGIDIEAALPGLIWPRSWNRYEPCAAKLYIEIGALQL